MGWRACCSSGVLLFALAVVACTSPTVEPEVPSPPAVTDPATPPEIEPAWESEPEPQSESEREPASAPEWESESASLPEPPAGPGSDEPLPGFAPSEGRLDRYNRGMLDFNYGLLQYVLKPVARGYNFVIPKIAQQGVSNAILNLYRPRDLINSLLQAKPERGGRHLAHFLINTTVGIGGLFYVSGYVLEDDSPETFNETLGVWGVPSGPYVVLPILGDSSPRAIVGLGGDAVMSPLFWIGGLAGTVVGIGVRSLDFVNTIATLMPKPWASGSEWQAFHTLFAERTPYPEQKQLYFDNQQLDVED